MSIASQKPAKIVTNAEMKELLQEIDVEVSIDAVSEICREFHRNGIALPFWTRGVDEVIPLIHGTRRPSDPVDILHDQFEQLKLRYRRTRWI